MVDSIAFSVAFSRTALDLLPNAASGYQVTDLGVFEDPPFPVFATFVDLPNAVATARKAGGMTGNLTVNGGRAWYVDGLTGAYLPGDVSGNIEYLQAEWNQAARSVKAFLENAARQLGTNAASSAVGGGGDGVPKYQQHSSGGCGAHHGYWSCGTAVPPNCLCY